MQKITDLPIDKAAEKIDKSLRYSLKDGGWWAVMQGIADAYIPAFALFLKATATQISLLATLPELIASFFQLSAVKLSSIVHSRKRIVITLAAIQAVIWLSIALVGVLTQNVWFLILLVIFYQISAMLPSPAWTSWMGDLVYPEQRGRYFGKRNRIIGFVSFLSITIAGFILDAFSQLGTLKGFLLIFVIGFFGRLISIIYLFAKFEPAVDLREPRAYSMLSFVREFRTNKFALFSFYNMVMQFGVFLVAPLFVIYWVDTLQFSYIQYSILVAVPAIVRFITMTYWGNHVDEFGNANILASAGVLISIIPLLWYAAWFLPTSLHFAGAVFVQIIGGISWAGFNLTTENYLFDAVDPPYRIRFRAYYSMMRGLAVFCGGLFAALLGGMVIVNPVIARFIPGGFFLCLILSTIIRIIANIVFLPKLKDLVPKPKPHILHFVTFMPMQGVMLETMTGMNRTVKEFRVGIRKVEKYLFKQQK